MTDCDGCPTSLVVTIIGAVLFLLFALLYFGEAYESAFGLELSDAIGAGGVGLDSRK